MTERNSIFEMPTIRGLRHPAIIAGLLFSAGLQAAPEVSGVQAVDSPDGKSIEVSIQGKGFGPQPRVIVYDDFDDGEDGAYMTDLDAPKIGAWYEIREFAREQPIYYADSSYVGRNSIIVREANHPSGYGGTRGMVAAGNEVPSNHKGLEYFTEIFTSVWMKDVFKTPGGNGTETSFSTDPVSTSKEIWFMLGNRGDRRPPDNWSQGHDIFTVGRGGSTERWSANGGNNTSNTVGTIDENVAGVDGVVHDAHNFWKFQGWNRFYHWARLNVDDPYGATSSSALGYFNGEQHSYTRNLGRIQLINDMTMWDVPVAAWDRVKVPGWYRGGNEPVRRLFDEIYIAIGPNAQARVELGDSPAYYESRRLAIVPASQWSAEEIVVNVPDYVTNSFGDKAYVFFIDGEGNVSSPGLPIEGCAKCPKPPVATVE